MDDLEVSTPPGLETESGSLPPSPSTSPRSLWHNRDYLLLWSGQLVSTIGTGVSSFAFPFLVLYLTGSYTQAGIVGALAAIPYILFSLPFGALIDRWNRKRVMMLCDSGRAILLASIPLALIFHVLTIWQIDIVAFLQGILFVLFDLAEVAALSRVVTKEQLPAATGQNQATFGLAFLVAPALGGVLYTINRMLPFVGDAVSYLVSVSSLGFIRTPFQGDRTAGRDRNIWREIGEGIRWLWSRPLIRYMAFLTGMLNFVGGGMPLIIIKLTQLQGASPFITGLIISVGSIGGLVGALIGGFIQKRYTFARVIIVTVWVQALAWPFIAIAPNAAVLGGIVAVIFIVGPIYNIVQFSYRIALIPDVLQGRVNSVFRLLAFGFQPLGVFITGFLLDQSDKLAHGFFGDAAWLNSWKPDSIGAVTAIVSMGLVMLVMAVLTATNRHVRAAKPLSEAQAA